MIDNEEKVVEHLKRLSAICRDGQKGFLTAAQSLDRDEELAGLCLQYAHQRAEFADQLQRNVLELSGAPAAEGTLTGVLHRGWMNAKALLTGGDEDIIIAECEAAEDETMEAYQKALQTYMPEPLTQLLQRQYVAIRKVHDHFSSLKKAVR